jgi:hypothetical protein
LRMYGLSIPNPDVEGIASPPTNPPVNHTPMADDIFKYRAAFQETDASAKGTIDISEIKAAFMKVVRTYCCHFRALSVMSGCVAVRSGFHRF